MKHILLITVAFFFGLSSLADHEGKSREDVTYGDIREHITPQMEEAFYLYMAKEKQVPEFMRTLGFVYYSKDFESIGHVQDYWKSIHWKLRWLEYGKCPSQGLVSLWLALIEQSDSYPNNGRPSSIKLEEVAVLLYAVESILSRRHSKLLQKKWIALNEEEFSEEKGLLILSREDEYKKMVELESQMTGEQIKEAYLEVERLENLLGDSLYDESLCKRDEYYSTEDQNRDILEFLLEKGYIQITE